MLIVTLYEKTHTSKRQYESSLLLGATRILQLVKYYHLESGTSNSNNSSLNFSNIKSGVLVWHAGKGALLSRRGAGAVVVVTEHGVAVLVRVDGPDGLIDVRKDGAFDEDLGAHAGVDSAGTALVDGVENVGGAEADRGLAGVDVLPMVVGVGYAEVTGVLVAVGIAVADERCLVVVVEITVGDCDVVGRVGNVDEAIVVVLLD